MNVLFLLLSTDNCTQYSTHNLHVILNNRRERPSTNQLELVDVYCWPPYFELHRLRMEEEGGEGKDDAILRHFVDQQESCAIPLGAAR